MPASLSPWFERVAALLEDDERQSVLGDIHERGPDLRALLDLIGLVALRQLQTWRFWRTWLLAASLMLPALTVAGGAQVIADTASYYPWPELTGARLLYFFVTIFCRLIATLGLAWTMGFSLASLSKYRSPGLLVLLAFIPIWQLRGSHLSALLLFIEIPVVFGLASGWCGEPLRPGSAAFLSMVLGSFALVVPGSYDWVARGLAFVAFWPAYYSIASPAFRRARL